MVNVLMLPRDLIAERGIPHFGALIVAGLDERFGWALDLQLGPCIMGVFPTDAAVKVRRSLLKLRRPKSESRWLARIFLTGDHGWQ